MDGSVVVDPALPQEEVARALCAELIAGHVGLYELGDPEQRLISLDQALRAAADARYWSFELAPKKLSLFLTEQGQQTLIERRGHSE